MAQSGIVTQYALSVVHGYTPSGYITQNTIEILYGESYQSGIVTQDSLSVLHNINPSGYITQDVIEILYNEPGSAKTLITQDIVQVAQKYQQAKVTQDTLSVLHNINPSGYVTQDVIEILYNEPGSTTVLVTQDIVQVAEKLQKAQVTQDILSVVHNINPSGYVTQDTIEVLYSQPGTTRTLTTQNVVQVAQKLQKAKVTQDALSVVHNINPSGYVTQDVIEVLYTEPGSTSVLVTQDIVQVVQKRQIAKVTQDSLSVVHSINPSGRITQNTVEVLYTEPGGISSLVTQDIVQVVQKLQQAKVTQDALSVVHNINPSGYITQDVIEVLYTEPEVISNNILVTQDLVQVVYPRFSDDEKKQVLTQNLVQAIYKNPVVTSHFKIPIENLNYVVSTAPEIYLVGCFSEDNGTITIESDEARNATPNDMNLLPASPAVNDAYYFGGGNEFEQINITIGTAGDWTGNLTWEYWNGSSWTEITTVQDGTNGFRNSGDQTVEWSRIGEDWQPKAINGWYAFYVRARVSTFSSIITQPLGTLAYLRSIFVQQRKPIEVFRTGTTKVIPVDCQNCAADCCGPCYLHQYKECQHLNL